MSCTWDLNPVMFHGSGPAPLNYYGLVFALTLVSCFFLVTKFEMALSKTEVDKRIADRSGVVNGI